MSSVLAAMVNGSPAAALMVAAVWVALRLAPRRRLNAATRYVVWWAALLAAAALPFAYLEIDWRREPVKAPRAAGAASRPPAVTAPEPALPPLAEASPVPAEYLSASPAPVPPGKPVRSAAPRFRMRMAEGTWVNWLLAAAGCWSLLMLLRLAVSYALLERRKARAGAAPEAIAAQLEGWLSCCGCTRKGVRVAISGEISTPMVAGPRNPAVLIPAGLVARLDANELRHVGLHEAAHVARRDDYALLAQRFIEALFAWHPLVLWVARRIDLEREIACDDLVVQATAAPRPYAACLARMAELTAGRAPLLGSAAANEGSHLARRVELLLDKARPRAPRAPRLRVAALVAVQLAVACALAKVPGLVAFAARAGAASAAPSAAAAAAPQAPQPAEAGDPVQEWIRANAIRLATAEARHGFADMQPLKKVIGDARIVALGEATHGTREFFQLKHRMMEFLATEMGFTIFSIEANMPEAYRLNDFVLKGEGDPAQLLKGMYFWTWDTEEVLDMILWMREFNKSGKGPVQFTGFDMQTPSVAAQLVGNFIAKYDSDFKPAFTEAAGVVSRASSATPSRFGGATTTFPVKDAAGKKLRISGYVKTEGVKDGVAAIWARADREKQVLEFDSLQKRGQVTGTTEWRRYSIEIRVASDATNINWGVLLSGRGTAWFDALEIELDGKPYSGGPWDLDFESSSPRGFFVYGNGFRTRPAAGSFKSGGQSLEIANVQPAERGVDPLTAGAAWRKVIGHMESSREAYRAKAGAREAEWAIQNARVVQQCMQMRAKELARDASMAENVKWILDQNPGAKIVLWAHNGHVAKGGYRGYQPMGSFLREMYGDQMVVFGFGFNQGSFQAVKQGGGLRDFTVAPAPAGSLDATVAASGIPLLALDLRQAPKSGAVAEWLDQPHKARTIGAVFAEDAPTGYMSDVRARESFDALLFVEKTTAARKNARQTVPFQTRAADGAMEFRDPAYGVSFTLPAGWEAKESLRWGNRETTVWFGEPRDAGAPALYYRALAPGEQPEVEEEIRRALRAAVEEKQEQRRNAGNAGYTVRRESCRERTVGGRPALSCMADFTDSGAAMLEYLTYVRSGKINALFFGRVRAADGERYQASFDRVIETLRIP